MRFQARPTSDVILEADRDDPLLVRWQYGLGRAAVFTSDAKNRWAVNWVTWPGFDRLWANIFRDLLPHAPESETSADFDRASNELVVDYRLSHERARAGQDSRYLRASARTASRRRCKVAKVAAGHYRGRLAIGQNQGLFRVRPLADSRAFPEVGFYRQEDEMLEYGNNEALLRQIAAATGGRFNPSPRAGLRRRRPQHRRPSWTCGPSCWRWRSCLNLAELVLRKWKGILEALRGRRPAVGQRRRRKRSDRLSVKGNIIPQPSGGRPVRQAPSLSS